ncbi:MAG: PEP-CTERM sorting domain-containing protein, partial [Lacipirellulaceae bacterium]
NPFAIFANLAGTTVTPDPNAGNPHAAPTLSYVNDNEVILTETGIDHPSICQTNPGVCASDGGSLFESNGHFFVFSDDGGATPYDFQEENPFEISFDVNLATTNPLNRKGIGFYIDSDPGGNNVKTQFTAQTTNNLFGGTEPGQISVSSSTLIPNYSFTNNELVFYTAGDTLRLTMLYIPPERDGGGFISRGTLEYMIDTDPSSPGGEFTSGPLEIQTQTVNGVAIDGGLRDGTHIGFRMQVVADNIGLDDYTATFSNFSITDPTAVATADVDDDGDVDGTDFLMIQRADPGLIPQFQTDYGMSGLSVAATGAVPEPNTLVILGVGLALSGLVQRSRTPWLGKGS